MSAQTLLVRADAALAGASGLPRGTRARVAAWYARAALEDVTIELLVDELQSDPHRLTMASRLACLRVVRPELSDETSHAWWALSRVCHQHAFELTPTNAEVTRLVEKVGVLAGSASMSEASASVTSSLKAPTTSE